MKAYPCPRRRAERQLCHAAHCGEQIRIVAKARHSGAGCLHRQYRPRRLSVVASPVPDVPAPTGILYQTIQ